VAVDGVEGKVHQLPGEQLYGNSILLSPRGGRTAYLAAAGQRGPSRLDLYLDGKVIRSAPGFQGLVFSPDGARFGGIEDQSLARIHRVFVDGWNSPDYEDVNILAGGVSEPSPNLQFSPDSKRFAFLARNGISMFAVVDGQESHGYGTIRHFQFSPDGRRYAFEASYPSGGGWVVVVGGKEGPKLYGLADNSVTFSQDGGRVADAGNATVREAVVVIDGVSQKVPGGSFQPQIPKGFRTDALKQYFVFSPNGRRLASVELILDGSGRSVVILDGTRHAPGNLFSMPAFSPDESHFAYAAWFNQKWLLSLDGTVNVAMGGASGSFDLQ
jgi:hypothetical protein